MISTLHNTLYQSADHTVRPQRGGMQYQATRNLTQQIINSNNWLYRAGVVDTGEAGQTQDLSKQDLSHQAILISTQVRNN